MTDRNPFEPPSFDPADSMARRDVYRDQAITLRMIEVRDGGGYTFGRFLRWNATRYLIGILYFGTALTVLFFVGLFPLFYVMLGLFLGLFLRDFGWLRASQKMWPFTLKVMNWELVREIAEGSP